MKYVSGSNIPGFMPDSEPTEHDSLQEAKDSVIWWIEQYIDCMADCGEDYSKEESILAEFVAAKPQTCNVYIGDYVYWIQEA